MPDDTLTDAEQELAQKADELKRNGPTRTAMQPADGWPDDAIDTDTPQARFGTLLHDEYNVETFTLDIERHVERPHHGFPRTEDTYHATATFRDDADARWFHDACQDVNHTPQLAIGVTNIGYCVRPDGRGEVAFSFVTPSHDDDPYEQALTAFENTTDTTPVSLPGGWDNADPLDGHEASEFAGDASGGGDTTDEDDEQEVECPACGSVDTVSFSTGDHACKQCNKNWGG